MNKYQKLYDKLIHEFNGKYYIACYLSDNSYFGSLTEPIRKKSGCSQFTCYKAGLPSAGGYRYSNLSDARKHVRKYYGAQANV